MNILSVSDWSSHHARSQAFHVFNDESIALGERGLASLAAPWALITGPALAANPTDAAILANAPAISAPLAMRLHAHEAYAQSRMVRLTGTTPRAHVVPTLTTTMNHHLNQHAHIS